MFFLLSIKFLQLNINQSETGIGDPNWSLKFYTEVIIAV